MARGGARQGAGRKPLNILDKKVKKVYYLKINEIEKVNEFIERIRTNE